MQRWHFTLGLVGSALVGIALAPRLVGHPPSPEVPIAAPIVEPRGLEPAAVAPEVGAGSLIVSAGLDRGAILGGTGSERYLAITVEAPRREGQATRRPVDLAVVMDGSGSMSARGKIDYAKRAAKQLASSMRDGDLYSLVVFNDDATTIVPTTSIAATDPARIQRAVDQLYEGGGTNLHAGMELGALELTEGADAGSVRRMIVLSDGNANVGVTDPDALARYAATLAAQGVTVSAVGLGLDYNEDLLARIADIGGGTYDFVDDPRELESVFVDELDRTSSVIARETSIDISLADGVEIVEVLGWEARRTAGRWSVWMGDVFAGETRKIIARVRVHGAEPGEIPVASVVARYHELTASGSVTARSSARATAMVTADASVVDGSVDRARSIEANRAMGSWYLDMSTRAYERGEVNESRRLLRAGSEVLEAASESLAAPELAGEAEQLRALGTVYDTHDASSDDGKHAIKIGKEMFRAAAR